MSSAPLEGCVAGIAEARTALALGPGRGASWRFPCQHPYADAVMHLVAFFIMAADRGFGLVVMYFVVGATAYSAFAFRPCVFSAEDHPWGP